MLRFRPRIGPFVWVPGPKRKLFGLSPWTVGVLLFLVPGLLHMLWTAVAG